MDMEKLKGKFQDLGRYFGGKKQGGDYDDEGEQKGFLARLFSRKKNQEKQTRATCSSAEAGTSPSTASVGRSSPVRLSPLCSPSP